MARDFEIKWDKKAFDRVIQDGMREVRRDTQALLDRLHRQYQGQPVATVKQVLAREWRRQGGSISDPELTQWATAISEGTRIVVK